MQLLAEEVLINSAVVANNRMNRLRGFCGVNSYVKDLHHNILETILAYAKRHEKVHWLDVGCGVGKALIEANLFFATQYPSIALYIEGIDLVDMFLPLPTSAENLRFLSLPIHTWEATQCYELITAVHSFHYFGDKLGILTNLLGALSEDGLFIGHVDLSSIFVEGISQEKELASCLRQANISYHKRTKILICNGQKNITFPYIFLGASDKTGVNYTGQEAVSAYYNKI